MILRELFSKIVVDSKAALLNVIKFDSSLDSTKESLGDVEEGAAKLGKGLDRAADKGVSFGDKLAGAFRKIGRFAARSREEVSRNQDAIKGGFAKVALAGAGVVTSAGAITLAWAQQSQELENLSTRYQVSTDEIQGFTKALSSMGLEADDGLEAIKELRLRLGEANKEGATPLKQALLDLGISFDSFKTMELNDQLGLVADRLAEVEDAGRKTSLANDIAGEDLIKLLPFLKLQSKAMGDLAKKAKALNLIQSKESIAAGAKLQKSWKSTLSLFKSILNLVAEKLEPTFTALIETTRRWAIGNREVAAGRLSEFLEKIVALATDFIPVALQFAELLVDIVEGLGGVDGAIIAVISTMAIWKASTSALLGPGGPWIAGLIAVTAALVLFGRKVAEEDRKISRLGAKRAQGLDIRRRGEFSDEDLIAAGDPGAEILRLEAEFNRKSRERRRLGPENIEEARKVIRRQVAAGAQGAPDIAIENAVIKQINVIKQLEEDLAQYNGLVREQVSLIRDAQTREKNTLGRERAEKKALSTEDDKRARRQARELLEALRRDPDKFSDQQRVELGFLQTVLGLGSIEGLEVEAAAKAKGKGKGKKKEKTIEELIGLGSEGIKTISDLVPAGQGTTINNFAFNTTIQGTSIVNNIAPSPVATAADIAQEAVENGARVMSDLITSDQRELIGQVQG